MNNIIRFLGLKSIYTLSHVYIYEGCIKIKWGVILPNYKNKLCKLGKLLHDNQIIKDNYKNTF